MFVYFWSIKICALGFSELLENIFCLLLIVEAFSLQKVVETLEEVVVSWREVIWIWWMRQNFLAQFIQLLKHWLYNMRLVVVRENWTHSVGQYQRQASQFLENLIDLPSIPLRYNGFCQDSEICCGSDLQQTTKLWPWLFSGASLALGSALKLILCPTTKLVITSVIKLTFCCISPSDQEAVCCCCIE